MLKGSNFFGWHVLARAVELLVFSVGADLNWLAIHKSDRILWWHVSYKHSKEQD